jgi:hypothetical protein
MKSYRKLFMEGFTFNGKDYHSKSYIMSYHDLVKDILDGVHGDLPSSKVLKKMFGSTVYKDYGDIPQGVITRRSYVVLGDIFLLKNIGIGGINSAIERISKYMGKEAVIR